MPQHPVALEKDKPEIKEKKKSKITKLATTSVSDFKMDTKSDHKAMHLAIQIL